MTKHADLLKEICDWLTNAGCWYYRTNSHGYGRKGIPDVIVCYQGDFVAIEAKVLPDKPNAWQERELAQIRGAGGIALAIYDVSELGRVFK